MTENNFLPLDLNESLFFETGYEIGEMISISLDPDISIQKFSDYVSIRGIISLEGEYMKLTDFPENTERKKDDRVEHIYRSVAKVVTTSDEQVQFYHHFPIEISVPFDRISKIDDVTVSVEAFDYSLDDVNEMKVAATLHINGIMKERNQKSSKKSTASEVNLGETFQFDVVKDQPSKKTPKKPRIQAEETSKTLIEPEKNDVSMELVRPKEKTPVQGSRSVEQVKDQDTSAQDVVEAKEKSISKDREKENQEKSVVKSEKEKLEKSIAKPKRKKQEETIVKSNQENEQETVERDDDTAPTPQAPVVTSEQKQPDQERESIHINEQVDLSDDESADSEFKEIFNLTEMFSDELDDQRVQMKLRIVQDNETLLDIADRYEIPAQKIMHLNKLDDEQIMSGQLLFIPVADNE